MPAIQSQPVELGLEARAAERESVALALEVEGVCKHFTKRLRRDEYQKEGLPQPRGLARLRRRYKRKLAVDSVSFTLARGEIFGIVGHNGCGKSTLIRMISTLLTPDSGRVRVFGLDPWKQPQQVQRLINRVSVEAAFFKKLSAFENLLYAARLYGVNDKAALKRAEEILKVLGLEEGRLTDSLQELSRGMQQKVAIARALLTSPVLLLLDEPTTGLDPKSKRDVQQFIMRVRDQHSASVLLTSHDMEEVERLCSRIVIMNDGRFIAEGSAEALKAQVAAKLTAEPESAAHLSEDRRIAISEGGAITMEDVFIVLTGKDLKEEGSAEE